jgi:DNA-binding LacI/PurR family transcriptional regulator
VSPKTRKKVLDAVEQLGYIPNGVARGLRRSRMNAIGVMVSVHSTSFFEDHCHGPITESAIFAAQQFEQSATLYFPRSSPELPERLSLYCDGRCDGLVLIGQKSDSDFVTKLKARSFPFVCVTEAWEGSDVPYVDADQVGMADTLAEHLLELGHKRFAVFMGDDMQVNVTQRLGGCQRAFARHGISLTDITYVPGTYGPKSGYDRTFVLLADTDRSDWPTAIICFNDYLALESIKALNELGLACPSDMSVVGIDNARESITSPIPLTTVRLPLIELGQQAVEMLLSIIDGTPDEPLQRNIPGELIVRQSTAPPRAS